MFFVQLTTLPIRTWTWTTCISWRTPSFTWSHAPIAIVDANTGKNLKTGGELLNRVPPYKTDFSGWHFNITRMGFCLNFRPPMLPGPGAERGPFGSSSKQGELQLAVTIAYNQSDLELGWQHSKSDFTIYISNATTNETNLPALSMHSNVKIVSVS